jgi:hypothetical protein
VLDEFSAERVTLRVLEELERRRVAIADDPDAVKAAVNEALVPVRKEYQEAELPLNYLEALEREIRSIVPVAWQRAAAPYTAREKREFGVWRGGDPVARLTYVLIGLVLGGLILKAPFIPIWEKWFPFLLAGGAWWLPDAQVRWHKRRYAKALGRIAIDVARAQAQLDGTVSTEQLLLEDEAGRKRGE